MVLKEAVGDQSFIINLRLNCFFQSLSKKKIEGDSCSVIERHCTIVLAIFWWYISLHSPKKQAVYMVGTANQSVPESWPLKPLVFLGSFQLPVVFSAQVA